MPVKNAFQKAASRKTEIGGSMISILPPVSKFNTKKEKRELYLLLRSSFIP